MAPQFLASQEPISEGVAAGKTHPNFEPRWRPYKAGPCRMISFTGRSDQPSAKIMRFETLSEAQIVE
jgi:hypothetical protein